eukprot:TsM_000434600 transcript=TsM_000434600 gene=TsM_000434600
MDHIGALPQLYYLCANVRPSIPPHLPQSSLPLISCGIGLPLYHSLLPETLLKLMGNFKSTNTFNLKDGASATHISRIYQNAISGKAEDNDRNNNSTGISTISNEVSSEGVDGEARAKWECQKCGKTCNNSASLRTHKQSHSLKWKCSFCDKAFSRKWILQGHERTHTGEKPFVCPTCQHAYADQSNLRVHMQTHMEVKRWRCSHCIASFTRRRALMRHREMCQFSALTTATVKNVVSTTSAVNTAHNMGTIERTT